VEKASFQKLVMCRWGQMTPGESKPVISGAQPNASPGSPHLKKARLGIVPRNIFTVTSSSYPCLNLAYTFSPSGLTRTTRRPSLTNQQQQVHAQRDKPDKCHRRVSHKRTSFPFCRVAFTVFEHTCGEFRSDPIHLLIFQGR
jgi:hypothetical protein